MGGPIFAYGESAPMTSGLVYIHPHL
jgi:hypothetical protein